jgi:hypothetical protein
MLQPHGVALLGGGADHGGAAAHPCARSDGIGGTRSACGAGAIARVQGRG